MMAERSRRRVRPISAVVRGFTVFCALGFALTATAALPGEFFPVGTPEPEAIEDWQALSLRFPTRVKAVLAPAADAPLAPPAEEVPVREDITYLRVRDLAADLQAIENAASAPRLIVDLRYVSGGIDESLALGRALARTTSAIEGAPQAPGQPWSIEPAGKRSRGEVTLVLVNSETSGALEAVLDALQVAGDVLLVGSNTKGDTGWFPDAENAAGWRVIAGEFRRSGGASLLDRGVAPGLAVDIPAETELAAYRAFEAGTPVASLLDSPVDKTRFDEALLLEQHGGNTDRARRDSPARRNGAPVSPPQGGAPEEAPTADPPLTDRVLHRAVNALVAWHALHPRTDS